MKVTSKGQVTIPIEIRRALGLLPNTEVRFELDGDSVRITKSEPDDGRGRGWALVEKLRGRATTALSTDEILSLTRGDE